MREELECQEAIYEDELWKASKLKDENGYYNEELRLFMRKESQQRKLFCPECGENLILNAGNIKEPYFRHYDGSECLMANNSEYATSYYTRELLYALARRSFPNANLTRYAVLPETPYRIQVLINDIHCKIALNYISDSTKLERVEKMIEAMENSGIIAVWFCQYKIRNFEKMTTVQFMISKHQSVLKFIDLKSNTLFLKTYQGLPDHTSVLYQEYRLNEQYLSITGEFQNTFGKENQSVYAKYIEIENLPRESLIEYGSYIYSFMEDQGMIFPVKDTASIRNIIKRLPHSLEHQKLGAVYMECIGEDWMLPKLIGPTEDRKIARNMRRALLFYADRVFTSESMQMKELIQQLGEMKDAGEWVLLSDYID